MPRGHTHPPQMAWSSVPTQQMQEPPRRLASPCAQNAAMRACLVNPLEGMLQYLQSARTLAAERLLSTASHIRSWLFWSLHNTRQSASSSSFFLRPHGTDLTSVNAAAISGTVHLCRSSIRCDPLMPDHAGKLPPALPYRRQQRQPLPLEPKGLSRTRNHTPFTWTWI